MKTSRRFPTIALAALAAAWISPGAAPAASPPAAGKFEVPVEYHKLANGLKVVLSRDTTSPKAVVAVYYNIGFRIEPKGRTGFAHLFEHLMFQGSENLGKMEFIKLVQSNGGVMNGSTRFDFTNYFEIVPSHTLETALWAEADRMRSLAITQDNLTNQQGVVKNEVKVNVLNRAYGGFPWLDLPQYANTNWYNAHNFYGDLKELDAATLEDARQFFADYYTPSNAALVIVGDFDPKQTMAWIHKYFDGISSKPPKAQPDISEPRQEKEKRASKDDALATRPALAVGYHAPKRNTPEYWAMGLVDQILVQGRDSRLYEALVQKSGLTGDVNGSINPLGSMLNINGPTLWMTWLFHDADKTSDQILATFDAEIEKVRSAPVDKATLDRAMVKYRSGFYADPGRINRIEDELRKVTPELIQKTAQEYLRPSNRTILTVVPKAKPAAGAAS
jgi:predicted Zn-dependent peptidase